MIGTKKKELENWSGALRKKGFLYMVFDIQKPHEDARNNTLTELCNCLSSCQGVHLHKVYINLKLGVYASALR